MLLTQVYVSMYSPLEYVGIYCSRIYAHISVCYKSNKALDSEEFTILSEKWCTFLLILNHVSPFYFNHLKPKTYIMYHQL